MAGPLSAALDAACPEPESGGLTSPPNPAQEHVSYMQFRGRVTQAAVSPAFDQNG